MLTLHDIRPCAQRARELRETNNRALLSSLSYVLGALSEAADVDLGPERRLVASLDPKRRISGFVFTLHDEIVHQTQGDDVAAAVATCRLLAKLEPETPDSAIAIVGGDGRDCVPPAALEVYHRVLAREYGATYGTPYDGSSAANGSAAETAALLRLSMERIRILDEQLHEEIVALISHFVLIRSDFINAGTAFPTLGCIFVSGKRDGETWVRFLEHVVHESAHHLLYQIWARHEIILNEKSGTYHSPFRKELRPLSGIYHAMYVLARTIYALNLLQKSSLFDTDVDRVVTHYNNAGNEAPFDVKFWETVATLEKHAELTPLGSAIMQSCKELVTDSAWCC
jgi:HEXXH motif-containing protein